MRYGRTFLALLLISNLGISGQVWKYHFGQTPTGTKGHDPADLPVVVDTNKTHLDLGTVLPGALEFEGVLWNRSAEPQRVQLYDGQLAGVGRVKVGLPEDTTIPAGGSLTFLVRYDAHGQAAGAVKIPLVFMVGEKDVLPMEFQANIKESSAWVLPHRILLTPGDGTPERPAKISTRFNIHAFDGLAYDQVALEDEGSPIRILETEVLNDGVQGTLSLDPRGLAEDGKPAAREGEVRLLVYRGGIRMDAIIIQWDLK